MPEGGHVSDCSVLLLIFPRLAKKFQRDAFDCAPGALNMLTTFWHQPLASDVARLLQPQPGRRWDFVLEFIEDDHKGQKKTNIFSI